MRIAIATPVYPLPGDHTRGRYIFEIAHCLARLATVEVFFCTGRYPRNRWLKPRSFVATDVTEDLSTPDVKVHAIDYRSFPVISRVTNGYMSGRALLPHLKSFSPDVVLAYWIYPEGYGAWRCAQRLGVPCVLGGLGTDIRARDRLTRWFSGRALRGAEQSIMVSDEMRQLAVERFGVDQTRVHKIANGVNSKVFYTRQRDLMRQKHNLPAGARIVVYVGRFVASKGLRELVEAFTTLATQDPEIHLLLVGDGVMREELRAMVTASPWRSRVHLPGALPPEAVAELINAADLLCLPSYSEGYPNVVVEALACGRPVVSTDVGGTPELVNAGNGMLVPPRNVAALQQALAACLRREWDQQSIAAAWSRDWDDVARATLAVCQQAYNVKRTMR